MFSQSFIARLAAIAGVFSLAMSAAPGAESSSPYQYSRYGDFKSAQLRSTSTHGYGMYVCEMQMSPSRSVSTFWLYSDSPATLYMERASQLWRWNEIDFEFVPYTESTQAEYFTFNWNGGLGLQNLTSYGAKRELTSVLSRTPGTHKSQYSQWVPGLIRTDEVVAQQTMNAQAVQLGYTGGTNLAGNFTVVVGNSTYAPIAPTSSAKTVQKALAGLLASQVPAGVTVAAPGAASDGAQIALTVGQTTLDIGNPGIIGQVSVGDVVTQGTPAIPAYVVAGTTVTQVDKTKQTVTISSAIGASGNTTVMIQGTNGPLGFTKTVTTGQTEINVGGAVASITKGAAVSQTPAATAALFAPGTVVASVDRTNNSVTINPAVSAAGTNSVQFTPASDWVINFNGGNTIAANQLPDVHLDLSNLTSGTAGIPVLGTVTPQMSGSAVTGLIVRVFQSPLAPASGQTWLQYLAANTGPGQIFGDATQWTYPQTTLGTFNNGATSLPMSSMGSVNFWRVPVGNASVVLDFSAESFGKFNRTGIYRGALAGATSGSYFTSEPLNNEAFFWDTSTSNPYNPYTGIYTYVVTWTPTRMAQYILPQLNRSKDGLPVVALDGLTPVASYELKDYASLAQSGSQGTTGTGTTTGGQVTFAYTELQEKLGHVSLNLANYVGYSQASGGVNGSATVNATVTNGSPVVSGVNCVSGNATVISGNLVALLTGFSATAAPGMYLTSNATTLVPPATMIQQAWNSAYVVTLSQPATATASGNVTFTAQSGSPSFSATGQTYITNNQLIVTGLPSTASITAGMSVASSFTGIPGNATVSAVSAQGNAVLLNQAPPANGSTPGKLFLMVQASGGAQSPMVSWLPQVGQQVSGTGIPSGTTIQSVSPDNSQITLLLPPNQTVTSSGTQITLTTAPAGPGWSGRAPDRDMADSSAYVRSAGFFEWKGSGDGSQTKDFNVAAPAAGNDNFWVDFSDTSTWTAGNWQSKLTKYFNLGFTNNFTHLGAQTGISPQYPNISPANLGLTTLNGSQVLTLTAGANDLTQSGSNWKTPPNLNFFQISANPPTGTISATDPLLRVEVYEKSDHSRYWTANTPVLGPTYIYAPAKEGTVDLVVNLWVLTDGTLTAGSTPPAAGYTAELTLTNTKGNNPSFAVVSDPHGIIATTPGRFIQVQQPLHP